MDALQSWLQKWSHKLERFLFSSALFFLVLLVAGQLLMNSSRARYYLNRVEFLEGEPYLWSEETFFPDTFARGAAEEPEGAYWVELSLTGGSARLNVLRNGDVAGVLHQENLKVLVQPGDLIELEGEIDGSDPVVVEVLAVHGLAYPSAGMRVTTFGDYDLLGWAVPGDSE